MKFHSVTDDKESLHVNLARLKKGGEKFEVSIIPEKVIELKEGKNVEIREVLNNEHIFADAKKGELASETHMESVFGTNDPLKVAKVILDEGEIQLTEEIREKSRQQKKDYIINKIAREAIDPVTKLPHPVERIKLAMDEAKIRINEFRSADHQIDEIVSKLKTILRISFEKKAYEIKIPSQYAGKAQSAVRKNASIKREKWGNDGSWIVEVEVSGGAAQDLMDEINSTTHGEATVEERK